MQAACRVPSDRSRAGRPLMAVHGCLIWAPRETDSAMSRSHPRPSRGRSRRSRATPASFSAAAAAPLPSTPPGPASQPPPRAPLASDCSPRSEGSLSGGSYYDESGDEESHEESDEEGAPSAAVRARTPFGEGTPLGLLEAVARRALERGDAAPEAEADLCRIAKRENRGATDKGAGAEHAPAAAAEDGEEGSADPDAWLDALETLLRMAGLPADILSEGDGGTVGRDERLPAATAAALRAMAAALGVRCGTAEGARSPYYWAIRWLPRALRLVDDRNRIALNRHRTRETGMWRLAWEWRAGA